jgi:HmuY protein
MKRVYEMAAYLVAAVLVISVVSCSKYQGDWGESTSRSMTIDTRSYTTWTYFSFEKGVLGVYKENEFDYKNNTEWDLAFHRWDVRTNCGESGSGKGGAYQTQYGGPLNVDIWSIMPSKGEFVEDTHLKTYMAPPSMDPSAPAEQRLEVPANLVLSKWLEVQMSTIPPKYVILDKAFVVRTASGKHAAIKFTNYMNDKAVKGYASFDYVYPLD